MSCAPTEPVDKHDDISVLQDFINNSSETLLASLDTDSSGMIEPLELGEQTWNDNGRIIILNCDSIGLSGRIPESIGALTELAQLGLKNNNLSGEIPESIGNLTQLTQLSLSKNSLSGAIPDTIGNLKSLWWLDLSYNQLSGTLPGSLSNLSILEVLLTDSNNLSGPIPQEICNIYNPNSNFEFSGNQFCPPLPYCIDSPNLIGYQNCDTSCGSGNTYVNGYCYSQTDLNVLDSIIVNSNADSLNKNMDIDSSGSIENLELGLQEWSAGRLKALYCFKDEFNCNISGQIPGNIGNLDKLKVLSLQENNLFGEIPVGIGNLSELEVMNLAYNNLSGELPESTLNLPNLTSFSVGENQLSGTIPENICTMFSNLEHFILSDNKFCPCYPNCSIESGQYDDFVNNQDITDCSSCNAGFTPEQICDNLPASVTILEGDSFWEGDSLCFKTDNLAVLDTFILNSLDTLPDSLDLSMDTDSSGTIEALELGEQYWANGKLISIDAKNRGLSGGIPQNIGSLDSLFSLIISGNHLTGELPSGIFTLTNLYSLHLSRNQLSGEILPAICMMIDNWDTDGFNPNRSYLDNNKFCKGEEGYPECIAPYVGVQDTSSCSQSEAP